MIVATEEGDLTITPQKIYVVMVIEDIVDVDSFPFTSMSGDTRIVGWYSGKNVTIESVKENLCDIHETMYNYALVEEIQEGMYNPASKQERWLFKYNKESGMYEQTDEPDSWSGLGGFTIG